MKYAYHNPGMFTRRLTTSLETWDEALSGCAQRQVRNADLEVLVSGGRCQAQHNSRRR